MGAERREGPRVAGWALGRQNVGMACAHLEGATGSCGVCIKVTKEFNEVERIAALVFGCI